VRGINADASLTAFVVIAMQEARGICAGPVAVSTALPLFSSSKTLIYKLSVFFLGLTSYANFYRVCMKVSRRLLYS